MITIMLEDNEVAAVLAGLRLVQQKLRSVTDSTSHVHFRIVGSDEEETVNHILDDGGTIFPMGPDDIEMLCERINTGE